MPKRRTRGALIGPIRSRPGATDGGTYAATSTAQDEVACAVEVGVKKGSRDERVASKEAVGGGRAGRRCPETCGYQRDTHVCAGQTAAAGAAGRRREEDARQAATGVAGEVRNQAGSLWRSWRARKPGEKRAGSQLTAPPPNALAEGEAGPLFRALYGAFGMAPAARDMADMLPQGRLCRVLIAPVQAPAYLVRAVGQPPVKQQVVEQRDIAGIEFDGDRLIFITLQIVRGDLQVVLLLFVRHDAQPVRPRHELHTAVRLARWHERRPDIDHVQLRHAVCLRAA